MTIGITIFSSFGYDHITMFQWVDMHVKQQSHCIASNKLRKFTKINIISTHNNKLIRALLFSCNVMYTSIFGITQNEHIYHLMSRVRRNEIDMYMNLWFCKITYLYIITTYFYNTFFKYWSIKAKYRVTERKKWSTISELC